MREAPPATGQVVFYESSSMRMWESLEDDFPGVGLLNQVRRFHSGSLSLGFLSGWWSPAFPKGRLHL